MGKRRFGKALAFALALASFVNVSQKNAGAFGFGDFISLFGFGSKTKEEPVEEFEEETNGSTTKKSAGKSNNKSAGKKGNNSNDGDDTEGRILSTDKAIARAKGILEGLNAQIEQIATPGLRSNMDSSRRGLERKLRGNLNVRTANTLLEEVNQLASMVESILSNQIAMAKSAELEQQKIELEKQKAEEEKKRQEGEAEFQRQEIQRIKQQEKEQQEAALASLKRAQHANLSFIETQMGTLKNEATVKEIRDRMGIISRTIEELTVDEVLSGNSIDIIKQMMDDLNKVISESKAAELASEIRTTRNSLAVKIQQLSAKGSEFTDPGNASLTKDLLDDLRNRIQEATTLDGLNEIRGAVMETETTIDGLLEHERFLAEKKRVEDELQAELLAKRNMAVTVSKLRTGALKLEDVYGGNETAIARLNDWQKSVQQYKVSKSIPASKGAVLLGPPGVGKTMLTQLHAASKNMEFMTSTPADLAGDKGFQKLTEIFKTANQFAKEGRDVVLLLDEVDGMTTDPKIATALQNMIDKFNHLDSSGSVYIIATSNFMDRIPSALVRAGRMDVVININNPTIPDIVKVIKVQLKGVRLAPNVNLEYIAGRLVGSSGAKIEKVVNDAIEINLERTGAEKLAKVVIQIEDLETAISRLSD